MVLAAGIVVIAIVAFDPAVQRAPAASADVSDDLPAAERVYAMTMGDDRTRH